MPRHPRHAITDSIGREWEVYDFRLLYPCERTRGAALEVLLNQPAPEALWSADDPKWCARFANRKPDRVDPTNSEQTLSPG
jgi:hypothetical protein